MVGGCIIPRRDNHLLQLYAFWQKLILIFAEPLLQPHRTPGVEPSLRTTSLDTSLTKTTSLLHCYTTYYTVISILANLSKKITLIFSGFFKINTSERTVVTLR